MKLLNTIVAISALVSGAFSMAAENPAENAKPTIALVHGAFEDSHVWQGVEAKLKADGYPSWRSNCPAVPAPRCRRPT